MIATLADPIAPLSEVACVDALRARRPLLPR